MILWLPDSATLNDDRYHNTHPWGRICYDKENVTRLTQNKTYCSAVQNSKYQPSSLLDKVPYPNPFHNNHDMFLDLVDSAILHYIITNADRKTNWVNNGIYQNLFVMLDNGKSFQDPGRDEWLLLAPLFQCCRVRQTTYERLRVLEKGVLSSVMREVLKADPVSPVLTDPHLTAMDRRLAHVILEIQECARTQGPSHVFR
ncbi:glycosaminoglycan xylosylkinase-like [Littorina saxatilis]|uniref:glycosaminoglycan xylosylkinase-like n=1 Tax=Littorina saxatilis TaxID=31220 RepID=UPI0038B69C24